MLIKVIKILLFLPFMIQAQVIIATNVYTATGTQNTGNLAPDSASTTAEDVWVDGTAGDWQNPVNIFGTGEASIIDNLWDATDKSEVLKGWDFDVSLPSGSTITGVVCIITCRASVENTTIGLVQLLNTSGARVGTNLASTPTTISSTSTAYTFGASNNLWGNELTETWVESNKFGVGIGLINGTNNADAYVDVITLNIYYTTP